MPLLLALPAPGSPGRLLAPTARLATGLVPRLRLGLGLARPLCPPAPWLLPAARAYSATRTPNRPLPCAACHRHDLPPPCARHYTAQAFDQHSDWADHDMDVGSATLESSSEPGAVDDSPHLDNGQFRAQPSRNKRKAMRRSQPARVLAAIQGPARDLYLFTRPPKTDLSYNSPLRFGPGGRRRRSVTSPSAPDESTQHTLPVSLYTILARRLQCVNASPSPISTFEYTQQELHLLHAKGFTSESPNAWANALVNPDSLAATDVFKPGTETPPLFLLLLILRRKRIRISALGVLMRHIDSRLDADPINWSTLKILTIRLLRHVRVQWHESIPWVAHMFTTQAARIHGDGDDVESMSPCMLSNVTHFCNTLLTLLSLPANVNPILASRHQEAAQFRVLQFMANRTPAIAVTRPGFLSVTSIQLAHSKTEQERDWAELKGPWWPPWKEDRTAMDQDKGYEYGASRASKILHRMFGAGYSARAWEDVAGIYAGWDTDLSPTIQTRTLHPHLPVRSRNKKRLNQSLWAGRIRSTRTRREAWACFLAYEQSRTPAHGDIYLAMFEKLHHREGMRQPEADSHLGTEGHVFKQPPASLLPGDMKEVLPNPTSPMHLVYLAEAVPTYEQFYRRMLKKHHHPSRRLLAFLLETHSDFDDIIKLLDMAKGDWDGGIGCLVDGIHNDNSPVRNIPDYLLAAFIRFLCRFGRFAEPPLGQPQLLSPEQHAHQFKTNRHYLLEYGHALLSHYRPSYQPSWAAFIEKVLCSEFTAGPSHSRFVNALYRSQVRYKIVINVVQSMKKTDIDINDDTFRHVCMAIRYGAQAARQDISSTSDVLTIGPWILRTLFHGLVGAHGSPTPTQPALDLHTIPPHIPGPAELHAYVCALGLLRDYEGLYSFSTWLVNYHDEVTARANAQHSGSKTLFRTLVALRAAMEGWLEPRNIVRPQAPAELCQLVEAQINSVEAWGGWPSEECVNLYVTGKLKNSSPYVGGR